MQLASGVKITHRQKEKNISHDGLMNKKQRKDFIVKIMKKRTFLNYVDTLFCI